jgi:hypothetical protein
LLDRLPAKRSRDVDQCIQTAERRNGFVYCARCRLGFCEIQIAERQSIVEHFALGRRRSAVQRRNARPRIERGAHDGKPQLSKAAGDSDDSAV